MGKAKHKSQSKSSTEIAAPKKTKHELKFDERIAVGKNNVNYYRSENPGSSPGQILEILESDFVNDSIDQPAEEFRSLAALYVFSTLALYGAQNVKDSAVRELTNEYIRLDTPLLKRVWKTGRGLKKWTPVLIEVGLFVLSKGKSSPKVSSKAAERIAKAEKHARTISAAAGVVGTAAGQLKRNPDARALIKRVHRTLKNPPKSW